MVEVLVKFDAETEGFFLKFCRSRYEALKNRLGAPFTFAMIVDTFGFPRGERSRMQSGARDTRTKTNARAQMAWGRIHD